MGERTYYDQHVVAKFKADSEAPSLQGQRMVCVRRQCPVKIQGGGEVVSSGLAVL